MSSEVDFIGTIADVVVGVGASVGLAIFEVGRTLIEANEKINKQNAEVMRRIQEAAAQRKQTALAVHEQLVDMCEVLLSKIQKEQITSGAIDSEEFERIESELHGIIDGTIPDDVMQIESLNSVGFIALNNITAKHQRLLKLQIERGRNHRYDGLALADAMKSMEIAIAAMNVQETNGTDVQVVAPEVVERAGLNQRLTNVTSRIQAALEHTAELASGCGLLRSNRQLLLSCFNDVDAQIKKMYMPSTSNGEMKSGIDRLEGLFGYYDTVSASIERSQKEFAGLYQVYINMAKALGEPIRSFEELDELKKSLENLSIQYEKAKTCAELYQKYGREVYICYAWEQELKALGYSVHTRDAIIEMTGRNPQHVRYGEKKRLPPYHWTNGDLTQLFDMSDDCSLQVIVHEDGTVTMKTISDANEDNVKSVQKEHCSRLAELHENLRKNWFIMYDYQETASANEVTTVAEWFESENSAWKPAQREMITDERVHEGSETQVKRAK